MIEYCEPFKYIVANNNLQLLIMKVNIKKLFPALLCLLMYNTNAQSITEQFETDNATTFSEGGVNFTLNEEFHIENSGSDNNFGVGPSARYVDISNNYPPSTGYKGSLYITNGKQTIVDTIYLFPSINCVAPSSSGMIVLNGYSNGSLVSTETVSSFPTYVYLSYENGFTTTASNNPSAFWFDVTTADNSTAGNNPGWVAFIMAAAAGYGYKKIADRRKKNAE